MLVEERWHKRFPRPGVTPHRTLLVEDHTHSSALAGTTQPERVTLGFTGVRVLPDT